MYLTTIKPQVLVVTLTQTGVAQAASTPSVPCKCYNIECPSGNAADVSVHWGGGVFKTIVRGMEWSVKSMDFDMNIGYDLHDLIIKGTANDTVTIVYYA